MKKQIKSSLATKLFTIAVLIIVWFLAYNYLPLFAKWLSFDVFKLKQGSHLGEAIYFFLYDTPKVFLLLILVVFGVGIIRSFFTPERTRKLLQGRKEFIGNIIAAGLGIVTPFCTCSAVPLFIGFVEVGIPLGVTFSFLISAPMINEVALVLLFGLFGWKVAVLYLITGLLIAIISGIIIGRMKLEHEVEDWVYEIRSNGGDAEISNMTLSDRIDFAVDSVKNIVGNVWLYIIIGLAIGAIIHGYVPENLLAGIMGKKAWWSVPLAVVIGVPMYSNAAGIIPIVQALLEKGASLGTVLAFMMAVIGLSLPETIILRKVLKPKLIAIFISIVATGILIIGYLFNLIL
ncbi:MAG: permease [Caldisericia bacterium]|nr:permease [Caldisericia bacterium]